MSDFWEEIAGNAPTEYEDAYEDLPAKVWVLAQTATVEDGGAGPVIRTHQTKEGEEFYRFNIGFKATGGEKGKLDGKTYANAFCFARFPVHPNPEGNDAGMLLSGQLTHFLNCVFSVGIGNDLDTDERKATRWRNTVGVLQQAAESNADLTVANYGGDKSRFLAACAVAALSEESRTVLFKTRQRSYTRQGKKETEVVVGQIEDATSENQTKRDVEAFEGVDVTF